MKNDTEEENAASNDDGGPAANKVSYVTCYDGTKEGASRKNGDNQRLSPIRQNESIFFSICGFGARLYLASVLGDKVWHGQNTIDVTAVIAKENASESSEDTHQVSLEGDGGLDTRGVGGGNQSAASHGEGVERGD